MDQARRLRGAAYIIGILLITIPFVETIFATLPVRLHEPPWRLGAENALAGAVGLPLVGLFLCSAMAVVSGDRLVLWLVSAFCGVSAALYLLGTGSFALDAVQMHGQVRVGVDNRYWVASGWAVFKISFCALAFLALAICSARAARPPRPAPATRAGGRNVPSGSLEPRPVVIGRVAPSVSRTPGVEESLPPGDERPIGTR